MSREHVESFLSKVKTSVHNREKLERFHLFISLKCNWLTLTEEMLICNFYLWYICQEIPKITMLSNVDSDLPLFYDFFSWVGFIKTKIILCRYNNCKTVKIKINYKFFKWIFLIAIFRFEISFYTYLSSVGVLWWAQSQCRTPFITVICVTTFPWLD